MKKVSNPTGKGGFGERPQDINRAGAPKRGQNWADSVKRITDMTRKELIEYLGASSKLGKLMNELPNNIPLKDALIVTSIIAYGRDPNPRMLSVLMDKEDSNGNDNRGGNKDNQLLSIPADLIAPDFLASHRAIKSGKYTEYVEDGGRGSTKSSFISLELVVLLINNPTWHALATRQVKDTLRDSVYSQLLWAINELGIAEKWKCTTSPLEMEYLPTGQKIYFRGADDPAKIKSLKPPFGHIALLWFEELDSFRGAEVVRSIEQSAIRGGDAAYIFKSFNPPRTAQNWANKYVKVPNEKRWHHTSNYLNVPVEWLGKAFIEQAEFLKSVNPEAYEHEYMGVANFAGGMVFHNIEQRSITDDEIAQFDRVGQGIDWGWYPDPFAWTRSHYDPARLTLYIFDEYRSNRQSNRETYAYLYDDADGKHAPKDELLIADSAEPKSIGDYKAYGANIRGAEKGPDSRKYSYKWLQSLLKIVIDPVRCPNTATEFQDCEYEQDKDGNYISEYPETNDHFIDSVRYRTNKIWMKRGE